MFFKKKNKKNIALDEAFARVEKEIANVDEWDNPRKLEQYILDSCEQIINMTRETENEKSQYNILTKYLDDINKIRSMTPEQIKELSGVMNKIKRLTASKQAYQESEPRLSDDQFFLMEEHEETILNDIHRMQENEIYQTKVERDMRFIESEKSRWEIEREELLDITDSCRKGGIAAFTVTLASALIGFIYQNAKSVNMMMYIMISLFVGVIVIFGLFIYSNSKRKDARNALRELNQNISLLNIIRMKYANVTKALMYEKEIYQVNNSQELHYIWEQYMLAVREQEKFRQDNIDLQYYIDKFQKFMSSLELHNTSIWIKQANAIVNPKEMEEIYNKLLSRRQKTRERITENMNQVKIDRDEIDRLMKDYNYYVPEIMEIITSVDKMCGLTNKTLAEELDS